MTPTVPVRIDDPTNAVLAGSEDRLPGFQLARSARSRGGRSEITPSAIAPEAYLEPRPSFALDPEAMR